MNWWILKQLRAMVSTDLRELIPEGYFESKQDEFVLHNSIVNAKHFSSELRWGYLAGTLGRKLFFENSTALSARQISASEVLMNLGMLAAAEAMRGSTNQLAMKAKIAEISDGNAGIVASQLEKEHIPILRENIQQSLRQYLLYLNETERLPFASLLTNSQTTEVPDLQSDEILLPGEKLDQPLDVTSHSNMINIEKHHFDVALSFPGEDRELVSKVAKALDSLIGRHSYFYDNNYQSQLARPSLDTLLQNIYRRQSTLIVVFLSSNYQDKKWCNIEFRAVREIIFEKESKQIMFIRTDAGAVDGIFKTDGYIDANKFSSQEIAHFIHERVMLLLSEEKKGNECNDTKSDSVEIELLNKIAQDKNSSFELIESFPKLNQPISIEEIGRMFLKFNNPIDRNTACFIGILQPNQNCFYQWDNSGGIRYSEGNTKLTYLMLKELSDREPKYSTTDDEFYRFEIHIGRGHPDTLVKDIFGNTLPHTVIPVYIRM